MPVTSISDQRQLLALQKHRDSGHGRTFAQVLNKQKDIDSPSAGNVHQEVKNSLVEIGVISDAVPTVSHILENSAGYRSDTWNIIFSDVNKNKQFTNMLPGTKVSIDPQTKEIVWEKSQRDAAASVDNISRTVPINLVEIGVINDETPTVSHILKKNAGYQEDSWDIIFSDVNKNKQFTNILPDTKILINPRTNELVWSQTQETGADKDKPAVKAIVLSAPENPPPQIKTTLQDEKIVDLGIISKNTPTVSHLLQNNAAIQGNFWDIIYAPVNRDKQFTRLPPGTQASLNTMTNELVFNRTSIAAYTKAHSLQKNPHVLGQSNVTRQAKSKNFSEKLADSIKPFIGRPYNQIDCYGLVVRGLVKQGVHYQGEGGLRQALENAAIFQGLPKNAFLNGEGLVENTGTKLYSKTYLSISNANRQGDEIFSEMKKTLETGLILSFSTPTRGHTGVVAKRDHLWTYINSGVMDNMVNQPSEGNKKVGEEKLKAEINNWCKLAHDRKEPLVITMGRLDEEKLRRFSTQETRINLSKL